MTNRTKNWVGHTFIALTLIIITYCLSMISQNNTMINKGRNEILKTIDGKSLSKGQILVKYKYAHGIDITHANELQPDSKVDPDFTVTYNKQTLGFVFIEEDQIATIGTQTKNFTVNVLKEFKGKIQFKNNVCGCEGLINMIYFVGGAITSLVLVLLAAGFYYSAKNNSIKNLILPEKEN